MEFPMNFNQKAFLSTIAFSEGTYGKGDDGYNVIVGGAFFDSYADHPRILVDLGHGLKSTAAGRYQLLERYFDYYKNLLNLSDFSPTSQDAIALQQIKESNALDAVNSGDFIAAIGRCAHIWASLPGATYGQHTNEIADLQDFYRNTGGSLTS